MSCDNPNCPEPWPHEHYMVGNEKDGYRTATRQVVQLHVRTPEERIEWLTLQVGILTARVGLLERRLDHDG